MRASRTTTAGTVDRAFADLRADYAIGRSTRFRPSPPGTSPYGASADYHWRSERSYFQAVEQARWLDRDDRLFGAGVNRVVHNVCREGIRPDATTGSEELNARLNAQWKAWAGDARQCDAAKRSTFHGLEQLFLRHILVDGDVLGLCRRDGRLQLVENHRLRTPVGTRRPCVMGVLIDSDRAPVEYWLTKDDLDPMATVRLVSDTVQFPAYDADGEQLVLHGYLRERISATRGVTVAARLVEHAQQGSDLDFAQLIKAKIAACVTLLHHFDMQFAGGPAEAMGESETSTRSDGTERIVESLAPGLNLYARPGEKIEGFTPNIPNTEYQWHSLMIISIVAINLGLPVAVLLLDPSNTNFSGWRGAMDQARAGFTALQRRLAEVLHEPTYRWKVRQWLAEDAELRALAEQPGVDPFGHRMLYGTWPYIEPSKDAQADMIRDRGLKTSKRRLAAERGMDWDDLVQEIVEDNAKLITAAHRKAKEISVDGLVVTWQQLLAMPTPDSVSISMDATPREDAGEAGPNKQQDEDA